MYKYFLEGNFIVKDKIKEILDAALLPQYAENVTTLWLPKSHKTRFGTFLQNKSGLLQLYSKELLDKFVICYIDFALEKEDLDNQLETVLQQYSNLSGIRSKLTEITQSQKRIIIVVDNFSFKKQALLKYLLSLRLINDELISFVFLMLESEFNLQTNIEVISLGAVFIRFILIPYFTKDETDEFLTIMSKRLDLSFTPEMKTHLYEYFGGIPYLLESALRYYKIYSDIELMKNSSEIHETEKYILSEFSAREKEILKAASINKPLPLYDKEIDYLKKHLLLTENNKISGKWVHDYFAKDKSIEPNKKVQDLILELKTIEKNFTEKEYQILNELVSNPDEILTRERLANILWNDEAHLKYSDWAIDKIISKIREKLELLQVQNIKIKTIKGKGFILEN